ncbi:polysaccharide biosynthesis/export family protein [Sphingobacterium rhinopitheci]|uniref:polysaccharide biosynthesis/export family protein n=1 Tax=Sphingobacterium rhinopitheci TaxID=2781960 RepID=UPI001F521E5F|nr:polysaccharide biosynthesis/export family protein [Sphingobacterium rhinopitheci]MCI0922712.1 polysaccharide biosynthesis/export family protein [Sphingobacterium rhinopitheci]
MKKNLVTISARLSAFILLFAVLFFSNCSVKKIVYFNDLPLDTLQIIKTASQFQEPTIQSDDILNITIHTLDPSTALVSNQTMAMQAIGASSAGNVGNQMISGFMVDKNGNIQMALLGSIKVGGLTTFQARNLIEEKAKQYYKEPNVQVRFTNFKVTILGEVARPATYTIPNEKVSILDALGLAGDLTIFGKRENVLLIRELNGQKELIRLNLNDSDILASSYFYLKQNDVLYVEPGKGKAASNNAARTQTFAMIGSFLSLLVVAFSRL